MSLPGFMTLAKIRGNMCYLKERWQVSKVPFMGTMQKSHAAEINLN